jgi:hypothetical protein
MDQVRMDTTVDMLIGFASGSEHPRRRAAELIDVLAADPRWIPGDIAAIRTRVEQRPSSGQASGGIFLVA